MPRVRGLFIIVRDCIAEGASLDKDGVLVKLPGVVQYLTAAHRDHSKAVWTMPDNHAYNRAWRYQSIEDAIAIKLVMEPDPHESNQVMPRIVPWHWRGKRALRHWRP